MRTTLLEVASAEQYRVRDILQPVTGHDLAEAPQHPHNRARENFVEVAGIAQPAPAPRFSRTPGRVHSPPVVPGAHTETALADWGFGADEIAALKDAAAIGRQDG